MARSKKSLKKIQSLVFIMLITVVLGITATYAWFSTQRDVEIAGMRLNVEVAESMQISLDGEIWSQSINIADMRQFYGTYQETGEEGFAVYQAKKVADGGNENYVPTELLPVSTAGEVANGKLKFVQGTVGTNVDGTQSLTGITACSETDITTDADIDDKEDNNADHPYFVFDMYLRNISAKTTGVDELMLNQFSKLNINGYNQQEGTGKFGTGLEYSARVGFVIYGNTVSVTAQDDATLGTVVEQIRGLTANNTEVPAIWEPNDKEHTQYVVNNNGRGITSLQQAVTTYGIKSAVAAQAEPNNKVADINADTDANTDGIEDTNANLVAVKTFKPAYTDTIVGTTVPTVITDINGNNVGLEPNQISKVRVYIWLEGQDPDCVDLASTGDKLSIDFRLTKAKTTLTDENSYAEGTVAEPLGDKLTATTLNAMSDTEKMEIYGKYVTNYVAANASNTELGIGGWRIFHSDGSNIYLIADDYVKVDYIPDGRDETEVDSFDDSYLRDFILTPLEDYDGWSDISSSLATKLLGQYVAAGHTSTKNNMKATAYLLDTNVWSGFKDASGYAEYAIGGPTLELFTSSYNVTHESDISTQVENDIGYQLMWNTLGVWSDRIENLDASQSLYVISDKTNAEGMWLASPSQTGDDIDPPGDFMLTVYDNQIYVPTWNNGSYGARPCIVLKSNIQIEKQEDGTYLIVE